MRRPTGLQEIAASIESDKEIDEGVWYAHMHQPDYVDPGYERRDSMWEDNLRCGRPEDSLRHEWLIVDVDNSLWWSNEDGWVWPADDATLFTLTETLNFTLPIDGQWIERK